VVKELFLPFPQVEFQALLTEIASIKPDAVVAFFSGGGAAKFLKDYQAAGLKGKIPLYGSGFLTDGVLEEVGDAAEGVETTLHYADSLEHQEGQRLPPGLRQDLQAAARRVCGAGLRRRPAAGRRHGCRQGRRLQEGGHDQGHGVAKIDSPRGAFTLSKAHNPVQDMYLRKVVGKQNKVQGVAWKAAGRPGHAAARRNKASGLNGRRQGSAAVFYRPPDGLRLSSSFNC
jgi:branched-chain amino acid transport system substrate-binding protein